ncbi:MDR/zinc-dependent alcohol dehydrogenase-like family protein [Azospirillum canadense]|uniref:hypothetical protein n=1 Tax=Azospirillum canadense TaxID=403962 RepID=UPI002227D1FA|nr:hypothetical protein [Azospirillum canadense]MCW2241801.1 NADPH:quinone reductase-like Zn-dependent oxidoreductase [Azospirillum canadense]
MDRQNRELRSLIEPDGRLRLWLENTPMNAPGAGEIVVRVEAAPLNPSDLLLLLGPADPGSLRQAGQPHRPMVEGEVPRELLPGITGRLGQALPVGNEGAGTVIAAGLGAEALIGRTVAIRGAPGTYAAYQTVRATDALILPDGVSARDGASAFINPLTALGMVETMRREGHHALVHTAAASNLGRMLNRLCRADGVPLVNIVRRPEQVDLLRSEGAAHVLDSSAPAFADALRTALEATGATLAFDAIGGGTMAATILAAMEAVAARRLPVYSRYGAPTPKQVYIYGMLDPGPRVLEGQFGMAWSVGGWLMTWFYDRLDEADAGRLRERAAAELLTTFASSYTGEIGLAELLSPDSLRTCTRRATGAKFLIAPSRDLA